MTDQAKQELCGAIAAARADYERLNWREEGALGFSCLRCGALVVEAMKAAHDGWHGEECGHHSARGLVPGRGGHDGQVWRCENCGFLWRDVFDDEGRWTGRRAPV